MEHGPKSHEKSGEHLAEASAELAQHVEQAEVTQPVESEHERTEKVEIARAKIEQHAEIPAPAAEKEDAPQAPVHRIDKLVAYAQTLRSLQRKLSPSKRTFSKVIHAPAVEKASEALENTVMRPSVALGATITTAIVGGVFYFTAHKYGFRLSGSEFIISLIIGGFVGAAIEALGKAFRTNRIS